MGGGRGGRRQPPEDLRHVMGLASEWLAFEFLRRRHGDAVDEASWVSSNRVRFFGGDEGDDAAGYDFCVKTPRTEWLYEVKSSLEDTREFELTPNEMARGCRRAPARSATVPNPLRSVRLYAGALAGSRPAQSHGPRDTQPLHTGWARVGPIQVRTIDH